MTDQTGTDTWICIQFLPALSMLSSEAIIMIRKALNEWLQTEDKKSYDSREITRLLDQFGMGFKLV